MEKNFRPGRTKVDNTAYVSAKFTPTAFGEVPGGLFPLRLAAFEPDDFRLGNGWPISIPDYDVRALTMISAEGEVLADRESPWSVETAATVRWLADDDAYNLVDLKWYPYEGTATWEAFAPTNPVFISDYTYAHNQEVFTGRALNFDTDSSQYMETDLGMVIGGASSYSVIMVFSLNSVYGNSDTLYSGIWCPQADPSDGWMKVTLQGTRLYLETDQSPIQVALPVSNLIGTAAPMMLAMVFDRPEASFYGASGPSNITSNRIAVGDVFTSLDPQVYLGRTAEDLVHTADMAILEIGLYNRPLTNREVASEFATLSAVYGGDK